MAKVTIKKKKEIENKKYFELDFTNLVQSIASRNYIALENAVYAGISGKSSKTGEKRNVCLRFSEDICKKLGIKQKDRVSIWHCKNNLRDIFLFKAGNGYTLSKPDDLFKVQFVWKHNLPIEKIITRSVPFEILETKEVNILKVTI